MFAKRPIGTVVLIAAVCLVPGQAAASGPQAVTFSAQGEHTYVVPYGVLRLRVEADGQPGSSGQLGGAGGSGADVIAEFPVAPGETLYGEVDIGGGAGGAGGNAGGGGGGDSDVRTCSVSATCTGDPRLVVAGGGGGGGGGNRAPNGGNGGTGPSATCNQGRDGGTVVNGGGGGGTCSAPGSGGTACGVCAAVGDNGSGATGGAGGSETGAGGGGGYFGGGGGGGDTFYVGGGGGGGSSFAAANTSNVSMTIAAGSASMTFTPLTPPQAPTGVVAKAGNRQAMVKWTAPSNDGGYPILDYTVTSHPSGFYTTVSSSQTMAVVTGLTNGQPYTFTVSARNQLGDSPDSVPSNTVKPHKPRR